MKAYEAPELELIRFQTEDVATIGSSLFIEEDENPNAGGNYEEP